MFVDINASHFLCFDNENDSYILIYAYDEMSPHRARAKPWLGTQLNGSTRVGIPWTSLLAFVRITSNPRVYPNAKRVGDAWKETQKWLALPNVWTPVPGDRHAQILGRLIDEVAFNSNLVSDAYLAALAIEHGLRLCSMDGDFARFNGLDWSNPLA